MSAPRRKKRDRFLLISEAAAGYRMRWLLGSFLIVLSIAGVLIDSWIRPTQPFALTDSIGRIDQAIDEISTFRISVGSANVTSIDAFVTDARKLARSIQNDIDARSEHEIIAEKVDELESLLSQFRRQHAEALASSHNDFANAHESMVRLVHILRDKRDTLADTSGSLASFGHRLMYDVVAIANWLSPIGLIGVVALLYIVFFVPPAEFLKPLSAVSTRLKGLGVAGFRVEFTDSQIRSDKAEIQYSYLILENLMRSHYRTAATEKDVNAHFVELAKALPRALGVESIKLKSEDLRVTLHVPFYFGHEAMFQVVDYYDCHGKRLTKIPGEGRAFSVRRGIIGRAWREERARYDPEVPIDAEQLIQKWGMTREEAIEAASNRKRKTFLAVRIVDDLKVPLGIIYMDAKDSNVFDDANAREAARKGNGRTDSELNDIDDAVNIERAEHLEQEIQKIAESVGLKSSIIGLREAVGWEDERRLYFTSSL